MFNFKNIFRNQNVDDIVQQIKDRGSYTVAYPDAPEHPPKKDPKDALFKVGMNEDGQTQLTVGYPTSITLTMNDASVAHLIKLLAVNIDHAYFVNVKEKENG